MCAYESSNTNIPATPRSSGRDKFVECKRALSNIIEPGESQRVDDVVDYDSSSSPYKGDKKSTCVPCHLSSLDLGRQ